MDIPIKVAIADDHDLMRSGLVRLISEGSCEVIVEANGGDELIEKIKKTKVDVVLMDINMPGKDGIATTKWITENKPNMRVIALTALDDDISVIRMLKAGARAYLLKSASQDELMRAIREVNASGYHFSDLVSSKLVKTLSHDEANAEMNAGLSFSDKELEFIKYLCTEMTNKEIADAMSTSPRTTEGWRKMICERLNVRTRVGIVLFAMRNNLS
jgi:two-component system, NarL family, invasion response regulator UvrY